MNKPAMVAFAIAFPFLSTLSFAQAPQADYVSNQNMAAVKFTGETLAPDGLRAVILQYIQKRSASALSCSSVEAAKVQSLPMTTAGDVPKKSRPNYIRDDAHELWELSQCGIKHAYLVKLGFAPSGLIDYWVSPMTGR
jgi:hypothetical protein